MGNSEQMSLMPTVFVSHGPPMIALSNTPVSKFLRTLGAQLPRPKAILCISAHWEAAWPMLTGSTAPATIHDFGGPPALFNISYPCPGASDLTGRIVEVFSQEGLKTTIDQQRGLDHGVWVPLSLMYPDADIPVVQLSVQTELDPAHHFELGSLLTSFREEGVLILGSGGATHNLGEMDGYAMEAKPPKYAAQFDTWLNRSIVDGHTEDLLNYRNMAPEPDRNHPYPAEHFLPLFVPLGGAGKGKKGRLLHRGFMYGVLSMSAYMWE
jgi:4,5-DOPA dioxygenase extradiol